MYEIAQSTWVLSRNTSQPQYNAAQCWRKLANISFNSGLLAEPRLQSRKRQKCKQWESISETIANTPNDETTSAETTYFVSIQYCNREGASHASGIDRIDSAPSSQGNELNSV